VQVKASLNKQASARSPWQHFAKAA